MIQDIDSLEEYEGFIAELAGHSLLTGPQFTYASLLI